MKEGKDGTVQATKSTLMELVLRTLGIKYDPTDLDNLSIFRHRTLVSKTLPEKSILFTTEIIAHDGTILYHTRSQLSTQADRIWRKRV